MGGETSKQVVGVEKILGDVEATAGAPDEQWGCILPGIILPIRLKTLYEDESEQRNTPPMTPHSRLHVAEWAQ